MFGADQQHVAETVQLQRDSQSASGVGHQLRAMHTGPVRDTPSRRCHARFLKKMRHDYAKGSRASLQIVPLRQCATQVG